MKCPICGNELEIKNKQIGTDNSGDPVFNEYAVCRDCKKQWNLDKQRAKKAAAKASAKKAEAADKTSRKKNESDVAQKKDENKIKKAHKEPEAAHTGSPKKRAAAEASPKASDRVKSPAQKQTTEKSAPNEDKRYSNIPPEQVRTKREKAVKKGYDDMLATGVLDTDKVKKASSKSSKNKNDKYDTKASRKMPEPEIDDYEDDYYESVPRFRAVRIILGIISLAGFGFFTYKGFMTGLNGTTDGGGTSGTLYIILALCMLVSSLLYFIMQKSNTIFAFLLPMLFYLGSGVFAFLKRGDDLQLLIAAIVSGVLAIISLILAITSRGGSDYDDSEENYDEAFEDDYAEEEFDD